MYSWQNLARQLLLYFERLGSIHNRHARTEKEEEKKTTTKALPLYPALFENPDQTAGKNEALGQW